MNTVSETAFYSGWYHDDYNEPAQYYIETPDTSDHLGTVVKELASHIESAPDTVTLDLPTAIEAVNQTTNAQEAIQTYIEHCPAQEWIDGRIDPTVAAGMLVSIKEKYSSEITDEERGFLAVEATGAVHELANLADTHDTPTAPCVYTIVDVLDMIEEAGADTTTIKAIESDLKKVIAALNSDHSPLVQPVERALQRFDNPENGDSLGAIVTNYVHQDLNDSARRIELKVKENPQNYTELYAGTLEESRKDYTKAA